MKGCRKGRLEVEGMNLEIYMHAKKTKKGGEVKEGPQLTTTLKEIIIELARP